LITAQEVTGLNPVEVTLQSPIPYKQRLGDFLFYYVFIPNNLRYNYNAIWTSVQSLVKVRQYLTSNPNVTVKIFLYTPRVGIENPAQWDWFIFMKNQL
jgi:hypothetical protein